jgi:D-glycero-D-manno-heptose 1,7-bisphosphate phosphatase
MDGPVFLVAPAGLAPAAAGRHGAAPWSLLCDRDGTVIENRSDYVRAPAHIRFLPGAVRALARATEAGVPIVLVTNQSPIGRGLLSLGDVVSLNRLVTDALSAQGVRIAGTYLCPHAPADRCSCRKPEPGMVRAAMDRFGLDPSRTALVGDSVDDVLAARRAGVQGVMVRTGRGAQHAVRLAALPEAAGTPVVADLAAAVERLGQIFHAAGDRSPAASAFRQETGRAEA